MKIKKKINTLSCVIIGLGKIGLTYDLINDNIQTHSKALSKDKNFLLQCGVDTNKKKLELFKKTYNKNTFTTLADLKKTKIKVNTFIISTPTNFHYKYIKCIIKNFKPKVIVCEKPISYKANEIKNIIKTCKNKKIKFVVNFIRRSDVTFNKIKEKIKKENNKFNGLIYYNKGFNHSCSHYINLMIHWFGKYLGHKTIKTYSKNKEDAEIDVLVKFEKADIFFIKTKTKTKKEFIIKSKNIKIKKKKNDGLFLNKKKYPNTMKNYQKNFYIELIKYIHNQNKHNMASYDEILYNSNVINHILNKNIHGYEKI